MATRRREDLRPALDEDEEGDSLTAFLDDRFPCFLVAFDGGVGHLPQIPAAKLREKRHLRERVFV